MRLSISLQRVVGLKALLVVFRLLLLMLVVLLGATFALYNDQPVSLSFVLFETVDASFGLWLLVFLFAGVLLGIASSAVALFQYRRRWARANKQLLAAQRNAELESPDSTQLAVKD